MFFCVYRHCLSDSILKGEGISSTWTGERSNEIRQGWQRWVRCCNTNINNNNRTRHWQHEGHLLNMWRSGYQSIHHPMAFSYHAANCCSFGTASIRPPPVSPVEHSSGDLWQLESMPVSLAGFQNDFEPRVVVKLPIPIGWWPVVRLRRPTGRSAKHAGIIW